MSRKRYTPEQIIGMLREAARMTQRIPKITDELAFQLAQDAAGGDAKALEQLASMAQGGDVSAMVRMATLYDETEPVGIKTDLHAARAW